MTELQVVAPPVGDLVGVTGDVAGEGSAHDHGDACAEVVALAADPSKGDGFGPQLAIDAHVHLRCLCLVSHRTQPMSPRSATAMRKLPTALQVCRLARSHNRYLICTNPRSNCQGTAGARDTHLTEKDAPSSLNAPVPPAYTRRLT